MKLPGLIPFTLAFSLATFVLSALTSAAQSERPNVIVIMSDDQGGGDYGFMGNEIIRTPELDVMAKAASGGAALSEVSLEGNCLDHEAFEVLHALVQQHARQRPGTVPLRLRGVQRER